MASILIVDDEFDFAELIGELLEMRGHTVVVAINGVSGLALLNSGSFDLVISDVMMPIMTGPEMVAAMRGTPRLAATPVIMMSGEPKLLSQAISHGTAQAVLRKPFGPGALYAEVDRFLAA